MPHRRRNKSKEDGTSGATVGLHKKSSSSSSTGSCVKSTAPLSQLRKTHAKETTTGVLAIDGKNEEFDAEDTSRLDRIEALTGTETRQNKLPSSLSDSSTVEGLTVENSTPLTTRFASLSTNSSVESNLPSSGIDYGDENDNGKNIEELGATGIPSISYDLTHRE